MLRTRTIPRAPALVMVLLAAGLVSTRGSTVGPGESGPAGLDREFGAALDRIEARALPHAGDLTWLLEGIAPFGPLDLRVDEARVPPDQASRARNLAAGRAAHAAGLPRGELVRSILTFQCGRPCAVARRLGFAGRLEAIQRLTWRFLWLEGAPVVAAWPDGGWRAGRFAYHDGRVHRIEASPLLGFVPWDEHALAADDPSPWRELRASRHAVDALVHDLRELGLVAMVREGDAVRVIAQGSLIENQAGVIFLPAGTERPRSGQRLRCGIKLMDVYRLADGVYFYTSR